MHPILRSVEDFSWVFIVIVCMMLAFVFIKFAYIQLFYALGNLTQFKETDKSALPLGLLVNIMIGSMLSLVLIPFLKVEYFIFQHSWMAVVSFTIIGTLFILIKFLVTSILLYYTNDLKDFRVIIKGKIYYRIYWLLFLILCVLLLYFSFIPKQYILYVFLSAFPLLLILDYYESLNQGNIHKHIYSYYFILYLCIFEILPFLYVYNHWYR